MSATSTAAAVEVVNECGERRGSPDPGLQEDPRVVWQIAALLLLFLALVAGSVWTFSRVVLQDKVKEVPDAVDSQQEVQARV